MNSKNESVVQYVFKSWDSMGGWMLILGCGNVITKLVAILMWVFLTVTL